MKLNKTQIKHLKASIRHWIRMRDGKRRKMVDADGDISMEMPAGDHCALCRAYALCKGCPVSSRTGEIGGCIDTPYASANYVWKDHGPDSQEFKSAADEEVKFLISLLPKEDREGFK